MLVGVEVPLASGGRADYVVINGTTQRFVEVKAWKTSDLSAAGKAATDFSKQIRGYVASAQALSKQVGVGVYAHEVHIQFRTVPVQKDLAVELVEHEVGLAARRKPPVILTYEGL